MHVGDGLMEKEAAKPLKFLHGIGGVALKSGGVLHGIGRDRNP